MKKIKLVTAKIKTLKEELQITIKIHQVPGSLEDIEVETWWCNYRDLRLGSALSQAANLPPIRQPLTHFWTGVLVCKFLAEASAIYGSEIALVERMDLDPEVGVFMDGDPSRKLVHPELESEMYC